MDSLTLLRPVLIKVKVTGLYKEKKAAELQAAARVLESEIQHLEFQEKRLVAGLGKKNPEGVAAAKQHLEQERLSREEKRRQLLAGLKAVGQLAPGAEVILARMEGPVEIRVGDDWNSVMGMEIVLEDDRVVLIRQGGDGDKQYD